MKKKKKKGISFTSKIKLINRSMTKLAITRYFLIHEHKQIYDLFIL